MLRPHHILQISTVALLCIGVVMVHSAGMSVTDASQTEMGLIGHSRHLIFAVIAACALFGASRINMRQFMAVRGLWNPIPWLFLLACTTVVLTLIPGIGRSVNGSARWLSLGFVQFQPSELMKWAVVLMLAYWCTIKAGVMNNFRHGVLPGMCLIALSCFLVVIQDLGTAALTGAIGMVMIFAAGAKWWHLALTVPPALGAVAVAILKTPYRRDRILAYLNPWADPQGNGYHPIQSMLAIAEGSGYGRGLGNGIQKFGYLPEDTTDFIFSIICEETGIAGALLVIALYGLILWSGFMIIRETKDTFCKLFAMGVIMMVTLQAAFNIAVVTVMVPTKGIPLPLISAGGTGWVLTSLALGLVASLGVAAQHEEEAQDPLIDLDERLSTRIA